MCLQIVKPVNCIVSACLYPLSARSPRKPHLRPTQHNAYHSSHLFLKYYHLSYEFSSYLHGNAFYSNWWLYTAIDSPQVSGSIPRP
ncbi:hypothetical protein DL93DRAFT_2218207 [Clavulina sp. PMI_390]|nr:hypothetical protein DL93DRAFT_2218207 [Clavulina sp. PMI_390]